MKPMTGALDPKFNANLERAEKALARFARAPVQHFIDGAATASVFGKSFETLDPATNAFSTQATAQRSRSQAHAP
jgi:hypothetical protein